MCILGEVDKWMTCSFMSFLIVFQLYQEDGRVIMKCCLQWTPTSGARLEHRRSSLEHSRSSLNLLSS